eukprot:8797122-Alexandrium_andersonii.AAC.1
MCIRDSSQTLTTPTARHKAPLPGTPALLLTSRAAQPPQPTMLRSRAQPLPSPDCRASRFTSPLCDR